jgi:hypothetical protein
VVEAVRLAEALAAVRVRPLAGLAEVTDAVRASMCGGSSIPMRIVGERLVVGGELGTVPADTPMVPLARDLARLQKSLRLKVSAEHTTQVLDLRQAAHLARSVLFHRLSLLGIAWATPTETGRTTGTFKEAWVLEWRPELALDVLDAGLHGTTVESAATARMEQLAGECDDLSELAVAVEDCLVADLPDALAALLAAVESRAARQHDTRSLLDAVEPLARSCRYGDVRGIDTTVVARVVDVIVVRASVGLAAACAALDDDAAALMRDAVEAAERGISLLDSAELRRPWTEAIARVSVQDGVHGSVAGRMNRILLDRGELDHDDARRRLSRQLSVGGEPGHAAAWLDGFLSGEAVLLLHDDALLDTIDGWVSEIDARTFDDLLPLLRRTFSRFATAERRQIGERVVAGRRSSAPRDAVTADDIDAERAAPAVAAVAALLGLDRPS